MASDDDLFARAMADVRPLADRQRRLQMHGRGVVQTEAHIGFADRRPQRRFGKRLLGEEGLVIESTGDLVEHLSHRDLAT